MADLGNLNAENAGELCLDILSTEIAKKKLVLF
jgi:hypothetical protein